MRHLRKLSLLAFALSAGLMAPHAAHGEGLQVAPVSLTIPKRSGVMMLNNLSDAPLRAQIRVYRWHQDGGEDELVQTDDLIASPPFVEIAADGQQFIRLVRFSQKPDEAKTPELCEQAFRVIVDELPNPDSVKNGADAQGLNYVLRYSVPVYLTSPACSDAAPNLSWSLSIEGETARLNIANSGQKHAQLASLSFIDADGKTTELSAGLFGYVLPGASRIFTLKNPVSIFLNQAGENSGQFEVLVNGSKVTEPVKLAAQSD